MRWLHILLGVAMLAFIAVQYNDPDGPLWMAYYAIPAFWAFVAGLRSDLLSVPRWRLALLVSLGAMAALTVVYWPAATGFWHQEVWLNDETAREGMGLMIALGTVVLSLYTARRRR